MNNDLENKNDIIHFFCDESFLTLENNKHILIGIVAVKNENELLSYFVNLKRKLKLSFFEEIKWNADNFPSEQRKKITNEFLSIVYDWTGILILVDRNQMYKEIFIKVIKQIEKYFKEQKSLYYTLNIDQGFLNISKSIFLNLVSNKFRNKCIQFNIADSSTNQLIQCTDLFTGFHSRLLSDIDLNTDKVIKLSSNSGYGMPVEAEYSWMVKMAFRYNIWGEEKSFVDEPELIKNSFGKGFKILESNISSELYNKIQKFFSRIYMGCIH